MHQSFAGPGMTSHEWESHVLVGRPMDGHFDLLARQHEAEHSWAESQDVVAPTAWRVAIMRARTKMIHTAKATQNHSL